MKEKEQIVPSLKIFNTPTEIGLRSLIILRSSKRVIMDVEKLMYLDYLILNTFDVGGPPSIHSPIPNRGVQIYSKKDLIQRGLKTLLSKELIDFIASDKGFMYQINDAGIMFLELFQTKYFEDLVYRSNWVLDKWGSYNNIELKALIDSNLQKWGGELIYKFNPENR